MKKIIAIILCSVSVLFTCCAMQKKMLNLEQQMQEIKTEVTLQKVLQKEQKEQINTLKMQREESVNKDIDEVIVTEVYETATEQIKEPLKGSFNVNKTAKEEHLNTATKPTTKYIKKIETRKAKTNLQSVANINVTDSLQLNKETKKDSRIDVKQQDNKELKLKKVEDKPPFWRNIKYILFFCVLILTLVIVIRFKYTIKKLFKI